MTRAEALLLEGRYEEGFAALEERPSRFNRPARQTGAPEWAGEPIDGKHILVWGEQGLGDEIQMVRFVRELKRLGAAKVYLACHPLLMRLFVGAGADVIFNRLASVQIPPHDYWVALLSLPHRLGATQATISGAPYLRRPKVERVGGVGLSWRGNAKNPMDRMRSMASPDLLARVPGGRFLEPAGDMFASAEQLAALDLLVTVDTSWAHLAGAIGTPAAVLLTTEYNDWRYGLSGPRCLWYDSMTLYRQTTPGDWDEPLQRLLDDLPKLTAPAQ